MLLTVVSFLLTLAAIAAIIYLVEHFFPRFTRVWLVMTIAALILGFLKLVHLWVCGWLCTPF